jgi:hypothetical protein
VIDRSRYARQMLLAEIGQKGQERVEQAVAHLAGAGLCHEIATSYAARAGIGRIVPGSIDEAALAPSFLEGRATRAVVAGSRAALLALRAALAEEPKP